MVLKIAAYWLSKSKDKINRNLFMGEERIESYNYTDRDGNIHNL